jgi:hypothetical protein
MDPEQLAALERALASRDFDRTSGAWTLAVSPFDLAALMRPISPAIDTRGLAAELIAAMAADAGKGEEIAKLRKKRDEALASIGDLWLALREANGEIQRRRDAEEQGSPE